VLVDPGWLAEHIDDPDVRVVEVDVSPTSPKPSAFTASSAAACATSSASHPAQPHASSTSGSSPQP